MDAIGNYLDSFDLTGIHTILALIGGLLAIFVMQQTRYEAEDRKDPAYVRTLRTISMIALSAAFFWSVTYRYTHPEWNPAPPFLLSMLALDVLLAVKSLAIWSRIQRVGRYYGAPSMISRQDDRN